MMRNRTLLYFFSIFFLVQVYGQDIVKPNVIIFYADDLGWQDTNLNNLGEPAPWETPNMDKLAKLGAKFSQAYSPMPTCAPSRAAMLSGRNALKTKLTQVSGGEVPGLSRNKLGNKLISPFTPLRMQDEEYTIAEALKDAGYNTGHVGKWHIAGANGFPEAKDQGFKTQFTDRGVHRGMNDRYTLSEFGVNNSNYPLDEDGVPFDGVTDAAEKFLQNSVAEGANGDPFFLYMATWLVHTPIQTRDLALLQKISERLVGRGELSAEDLENGIPTIKTPLTAAGDHNPFYGAMVETVDWSLGKIINYLEATDDPRNPGKKLFETTYVIFSSDNGASEQNNVDFEDASGNVSRQEEVVADNFPLDQGKTSSKEGGVRVPLIITGPTVTPNKEYSNVVNGLDFYPTIVSVTGITVADAILNDLDGVDLNPLLSGQSTTVNKANGSERTDMFFHYAVADDLKSKSTIRRGDYKLYKLYLDNSYEAYRLYDGDVLVDIEEANNVIETMPTDIKESMIASLDAHLNENNAKFPMWNPDDQAGLPNRVFVPSVASTSYNQETQIVTATISTESNQVGIVKAYLLYVEDGVNEEWHESTTPTTILGNVVTSSVPETATKVVFYMVDENGFFVLSQEVAVASVTRITLNESDTVQNFNPSDVFYETVGDISVRDAYLQALAAEGGQGANFYVKSANNKTIICSKVTFGVRSKANDTSKFDVTIGDVTQSFTYTSSVDSEDVEFDFSGPISFTGESQEIKFLTTALKNSEDGITPRFRLYDVTFHVSEVLSIDEVTNNNVKLNLYPNPVKNTFSLSKEVESGVLYNLYGAKAHEFNNQNKDINISNLKTGLYLLQVNFRDGSKKTLKLLKE
ncbi:sulfatase-like hydrolase/transferase [Mariniflexile sp. AS56]|uniref:sulfatase-like hydrolase/transferase n=1 Tax=Mariniflexile sp. AS56 TaxID=3063957 RepID=UPI0026E946B8|nr:sulfatase-like hydrolase/transferase [Mariniflexile sp. AS56]MDO7172429.1 sulfatase-like hydrolase/transferase [Mariniflexile sp. AS56]